MVGVLGGVVEGKVVLGGLVVAAAVLVGDEELRCLLAGVDFGCSLRGFEKGGDERGGRPEAVFLLLDAVLRAASRR